MDSLLVQEFAYGSPDYWECVELRRRILRLPLGMDFSEDELARESCDHHFGARLDGVLVGVLVLDELASGTLKMRQVAVDESVQRAGVGTVMVRAAEDFASDHGFHQMVLDARKGAVPFYLKLGYAVEGDEFTQVGIPHYRMVKLFRETLQP